MSEKRFIKVLGFIQDTTGEYGDVVGLMDLSEIEEVMNKLCEENCQLEKEREKDAKEFSRLFRTAYGLKDENDYLKKLFKESLGWVVG